MTHKKLSPPDCAGGARECDLAGKLIVSENKLPPVNLQHLRVAHLARRFGLAPSTTHAVADPAFEGSAR